MLRMRLLKMKDARSERHPLESAASEGTRDKAQDSLQI